MIESMAKVAKMFDNSAMKNATNEFKLAFDKMKSTELHGF